MASTQHADLHIDAALTQWATEYQSQDENLIADLVAPVIPVTKKSDKYWIHGAEGFELVETARGPGGQYGEVKWTKSSDSYFCEGHGLMARVPDEDAKAADPEVDPAKDALSVPLDEMKLAREKRVADLAFSGTYMTQTAALAAADRFNVDTSDPVDIVGDYKTTVRGKIGRVPNTGVVGYTGFVALQQNATIRKVVFGLNAPESVPTAAQIAQALGLSRLLVGNAVYTTAANTFADIWGKSMLIAYIDPTPTSRALCPLKTFAWTGEGPRYATRGPVWDDDTKSWKYYVDDYPDEKVVSVYAAYLLTTVVD
jgi:hypothetical protein